MDEVYTERDRVREVCRRENGFERDGIFEKGSVNDRLWDRSQSIG